MIYPAHAFGGDINNKNDAFLSAPIGTGPFKVDSFTPNDAAAFSANENYREPNKPFFATVAFKGGGDAVSAGRAVVQTGEYDYAWNVQAEPEVLAEIQSSGDKGTLLQKVDTTVESFYINFTDPNAEVDGQRSEKNTPNPVLSDKAVREALNVSIQRELISEQFYGDGQLAESNVLAGNPFFTSPNTSWEFNLEEAAQILDEAGWALDGDVRKKDGVELALTYATPINQVRQKTQQVVKADLESIGFKVELVQIDPGVFFDGSAGNEQNFQHFYWDIATISSGPPSSIPVSWVNKWYAGPDGENISQASNEWTAAEHPALAERRLRRALRGAAGDHHAGGRPANPDRDQRPRDQRGGGDPDRAAGHSSTRSPTGCGSRTSATRTASRRRTGTSRTGTWPSKASTRFAMHREPPDVATRPGVLCAKTQTSKMPVVIACTHRPGVTRRGRPRVDP